MMSKGYGVIVADPPWKSQAGAGRVKRGADRHYGLMSTPDIARLEIPASDDAVLFMWTTWNDVPEALKIISAWGFVYKTGMPWIKLESSGAVAMGLGHYLRGCSEPLLIATKGKIKTLDGLAPLGLMTENEGLIIAPRLEHSRKPRTVYQMAEQYPGPYLEVFARQERPGWDVFGNETQKYVEQAEMI